MAVVQTIVVDMSTRGANPVAYTHQNDEWRTFHFEMYNNGEAVDMTGWSCKVGAILPSNDGGYRVIAGNQMDIASINGNTASATLGPPYTSKAGNGVLTLIFTTDTGHTIRPINIDYRIQESADGAEVIAGASDFPATLEEIVDDWLVENGADNLAAWFDDALTAEDLETYINAWLDDHPEATTTVQDGSITMAKLNATVSERFPVATFEDMYNTTADEVTVLEDNSYYGSGQTVTFMKSDVDMTAQPFFQRANGDYMVPKPRNDPPESNAPLISIGETVASYVKQSNLVYGNNNGLFNTTCTNEIDCAMFSYAVLQGITYENSRYNGNASNIIGDYVGDNVPRNPACYYSSNRPYALKASEQAVWFAEQNRLFYIDYEKEHPCSQLRPGDLLFESGEDGGLRYLLVHHVVVVLAVFPLSDIVLVAQAGGSHAGVIGMAQPSTLNGGRNACNIITLKIKDEPTKHIVYARPNYGTETKTPKSVIAQVGNIGSVTVGGSSSQYGGGMARVWTNPKHLEPGKMYTLIAKGTLPKYSTDLAQIRLFANTSQSGTKGFALAWCLENENVLAFPFVPSAITQYASSIDFSAFVGDSDYPTSTAHTYSLEAIGLVEGLAPNADPDTLFSANAFTAASGVTLSSAYIYKDLKGVHIRLALKLDEAASSAGQIEVGTINTDLLPAKPTGINLQCTVNTQVRPFNINPGTGVVQVYYASGEGASGNTLIEITL